MLRPDALAGNTVGKYRVIRKLGQGGMAHVYLAEDTTLKRRIALKVLDASRATDKHFVARFQREASTAAGLKHPNIVTIYEVGELDGLYFIAMEYVEGQTLKDMLTDAQKRNQPLELDTAVKIVGQVAEALTYAYRTEQIVHRDVKPANIMVDQACHVTLTDFGIARALSDQSDLTSAGGLIGTPFYMSPEHAASGVIDHRSDIYSLGVVLYQMLTLRGPFGVTTNSSQLMYRHVHARPVSPRKVNRAISPAVEEVILKALDKKPERRFQLAQDMADALTQAAQREGRRVNLPGWVLPALAGLLGIVVLMGGAYYLGLLDRLWGGQPQAMRITAPHAIHLRLGPGPEYDELGMASANLVVMVRAKNDDGSWLRVETEDGSVGWVAAADLNMDGRAIAGLPAALLPPTPTPAAMPAPIPSLTPTATSAVLSTPTSTSASLPVETHIPTPAPSPTNSPSATPTPPTPTQVVTSTPSPSASWTPTPVPAPTGTATPTILPTATATSTPTSSLAPTGTATVTSSSTPTHPATLTPTERVIPTSTETAAPTPTDTETATPTSIGTATPLPPTHTPYPTYTPYPTCTPVPSDTPVPTDTLTPTPLPTATRVPTDTPVPVPAVMGCFVAVREDATWNAAKTSAERLGGHLATIASEYENRRIYELAGADDSLWYIDPYNNGIGPWLGGYQPDGSLEPSGGWRWVTGEAFAYTNWAPGQPDNFRAGENSLCLFGLGTLKSPRWNDMPQQALTRGYIVEFDDPSMCNTAPTATRVPTLLSFPISLSTGIALNPTGTIAWVTEEIVNNGRLVRVDLASGVVAPVATGLNQPGHLVVSGTVAFVAGNIGTPVTLVRIDLNNGMVAPVSNELGGGLSGVAVNSVLTQAHVVNFGNGVLSRVDIDPSSPTFKQVTQVVSGLSGPRDIVIDSTGNIAYITEQSAGRLVQVNINPASPDYGKITPIVGGLGGPRGLTLNQNGDLVYVAEEFSRELSVVDVDPGSSGYGSVTTILSGRTLRDVALNADERQAVVTDTGDGILVVDIDPSSPNFGHIVSRVTPPRGH